MNDVLNNAIPWIFGSAVFMGGVKLWWASKAKLDKLYPERPADPNANFFVKMINSFQNELLASMVVIVMLFSMTLAGKAAWFFVGKTTVATAAHATILGAEGLGGLFTSAADAISEFDGGGVTPEEMDKLIEDKSIFTDRNKNEQPQSLVVPQPNAGNLPTSYAPAASSVVASESLVAANASAPIAPAESAGQPGPVESAIVAEQIAAPAPAAPVQAAAPDNQYAVGSEVTVLPGDSLFKIAQRAYGDGELWVSICNANRAAIGDCNSLRAGMRLAIPAPTYGEQVVSLVTNSQNNPVAASAAVAPQGLASDGRVYYDVAIPTAVPASIAVGTSMEQAPAAQQPAVPDNTQIAASESILKPVVYDTTSLTPVPAAVAVQAVQPAPTVAQVVQTTADLMGKPSVDTGPAAISASN